MNQQQLEEALKRSHTFEGDRAARHLLLALNEEVQDAKRSVVQCAQVIEQLVNQLGEVLQINQAMKTQLEQMKGRVRDTDDLGLNLSTKSIGDGD